MCSRFLDRLPRLPPRHRGSYQVNGREDVTEEVGGGGLQHGASVSSVGELSTSSTQGSITLSTSGEFLAEGDDSSSSDVDVVTRRARRNKLRNYLRRRSRRCNSTVVPEETIESTPSDCIDSEFTVVRRRNKTITHHNRSSWYIERDTMGSKESHIQRPNSEVVHYVPSLDPQQEAAVTLLDTGQVQQHEEVLASDGNTETVTQHPEEQEELLQERRRLAASLASLDSIASILSDSTTISPGIVDDPQQAEIMQAGVTRDVAGLVEALLGPLYPNFEHSRAVLVRQARDLLVCRFHGNLSQFEGSFLRPAAHLLTSLRDAANTAAFEDGVILPRGWPFSLGLNGVLLQLGELDASSVRTRDCYLCVRPSTSADEVEVALVWRLGNELNSQVVTSLGAPSAMEELVCSDEALTCLLHSVLVSVERAIERVPLDQLEFPCPCTCACPAATRSHPVCQACACASELGCACTCHVETKDSSMQTVSTFDSIPHIDSDEDDDANMLYSSEVNVKSRLSGTTVAVNNILTVQVPAPPPPPPMPPPGANEPPLVTPSCVAELPPDHLTSGVTLTDSTDVDGRPIILFEALQVHKAGLQRRDIARVLLFYSGLLARRKETREVPSVTILIPRIETAASLELLDQSILLTQTQLRVNRAVLRKQPGGPTKLRRVLPESAVKLHVVGCETGSLRRFVSDAQLPRVCGGHEIPERDHREWVAVLAEAESLSAACHGAGRRLASALADLRDAEAPLTAGNTGTLPSSARRLLHHQHRVLSRALAEPALHEARTRGPETLQQLERRVRDSCGDCQHLRGAVRRAATLLCELERAAQRLERLAEGRRERLRDIARLRALEDETSQELQWLREKGEEALQRHSNLGTSLTTIKQQELDFDKFYFIAMRHLDRGGDLVEEAALQPPGGGSSTSGSGGGALHNLARSLKQHLRGFSDRLEDTRERLEDTSRCFYLLDKAYEWALEAKKYASRTETAGTEQSVQALKQLQHYLMAHPAPCESHFTEMAQLARKLGNDKLAEQCKTAHARCQETMEEIRTQRARLAGGTCTDTCTSPLPNASSTPLSCSRRRSLPAPPSGCAPYSAGHTCGCWEPATARPLSLGDIQEVRESAESLDKTEQECDSPWCGGAKARLRRSCTWQHPTESFEEEEEEEETCDRLRGEDCSVASGSHSAAGDSEDQTDTDPKSVSEESKSPVPPVPVNSHLYHHPSSLELPLSLDQTGDPQHLKTQKTLLLIMREMIQTERDYVRSLEYVIENFIPELLREDIPQAMRGQRNVVFGNIEKIYEFHSQFFLQELEKCETRPLAVGQCFLRHENKFYLYALYNKNKPKSDSLMSEYGTSFFRKKQLELGDRMDLASYLLKPVQRMGKYALLLQQLVKAQGEQGEAAQVADLKAAEAMVRFQLRHGNDLLAMDSLRDCDINVKEQGRLLRQNEFLVWQGKGKKCLRHVFLFEELILFSKARRFPDRKNLDLYIYKHSMKMTDIGLTALVGDSSTKFEIWFRKRKPNDTFVLQTMSEDVKQAWTEEISKLLWKQALRNREMRMVEMSSMGIGNKPCLDIRPSADQISDRSISISQLSKTAPRFRNSVVLGSGEHQIRSRRPHSIISVGSTASSSSASGGSGGSSGGSSCHSNYGTLNLDESSHPALLHHRSGTLHSQCSIESGIIADMSLSSEEAPESGGSAGGGHWLVERSNSSATSASLDSSALSSPMSPLSPTGSLPGQSPDEAPPTQVPCTAAVSIKL